MNSAAQLDAEARPGFLDDPLAGWSNDDLLFTKPARSALGARHPAGLRVLDWPELRALFGRYDEPANRHGRRDRRLGLLSVVSATLGLVLAAFSPLAVGAERYVGLAAAVLTLSGAALAGFHWLGAQSKARWLGNRYWTERVRGLYFQTIINNLSLVAKAMRDDAALGEWKAVRARALSALPNPADMPGRIRRLGGTVTQAETWLTHDWEKPSAPPEASPELDLLLSLLRSQRFDIQLNYTDSKLGDSLRGPKGRSEAVRMGGGILPSAAVLSAAAAGLLLALGQTPADPAVKLALALAASGCAAALALRTINDGLLLSDDAGRYAWYAAAVLRARARFDAGDLGEKLAALRDMETVAYRDLREFVAAHWRARYVM